MSATTSPDQSSCRFELMISDLTEAGFADIAGLGVGCWGVATEFDLGLLSKGDGMG